MSKRCPTNQVNVKGVCVPLGLHNRLRTEGVANHSTPYFNECEKKAMSQLRRKGLIKTIQPYNLPPTPGWKRFYYKG